MDPDILCGQILDFTEIHANDTGAADWIIRIKRHVGDRMPLPVKYALEHTRIIAHILQIHRADQRSFHIGAVNICGEYHGLTGMAAL